MGDLYKLQNGTDIRGIAYENDSKEVNLTVEEVKKIELKVSKDMKNFSFNIWVQKPNRITVSIISPNGEDSKFINPSINNINIIKSKK